MMTTLLYGLYAAGVSIALTLISHFTGMDQDMSNQWLSYLSLPFLGYFLWLAMKERKEDEYNGTLTYGQGVGTGALVGLWSGIIVGIFLVVYWTYLNPGFIDLMVQQRAKVMHESKDMSEDQIRSALSMMRKFFVPFGFGGAVLWSVFISTIFALIIAIFARTKEEEGEFKAV